MRNDDPWRDLTSPLSADALSARLVDANAPWRFYWARGLDRTPLLLLRHAAEASPKNPPPRLKGLEVTLAEPESDGGRVLALRLLDAAQREVFYLLCLDVIGAAANARNEAEAVALTVARTWRWHHLLRGGADGRLSVEEQKGLIGELQVLEQLLLPQLNAADAVTAWLGPFGAPKDFEVGRIAIEAKARRGAATPFVAISSEHQLSTDGTDTLFLHVAELSQAADGTSGAFCLTEIAKRLHDAVARADQVAADLLEGRLIAAGFDWTDDYSDTVFVAGPPRMYRVSDGFPSITPAILGQGIERVRYSISLLTCEPFLVPADAARAAISGASHGD